MALLQIGIQQILSVTAGTLLVAMAFLPILKNNFTLKWFVPIKQKFQYFFGKKDYFSLFMIGVLNGFLPCGLVWMALAAALSMVQVWEAMLYMTCFGVGTIPMMLILAFLPHMISITWRQRIFKLIPFFTFFVGILLILRGLNLDIPYLSPLLKLGTNQQIETVCE
jgi:sulfite exporter TauE/SafE